MPLTTVARGRVYDWSHAIGRGAATGTGFNYIQTMCLGKNGVIYAANRGNENNFGMRVNQSSLAAPAKRSCWPSSSSTAKRKASRSGRSASPSTTSATVCTARTSGPTRSRCSTPAASYITKFGETGSGDGELLRPAGLAVEKNGNMIVVDSGNNRLQVFSPDGKFVAKCGGPGKAPGEFNQPWGITLDKDGNIYVADWKNHRIQKLSPAGQASDVPRQPTAS